MFDFMFAKLKVRPSMCVRSFYSMMNDPSREIHILVKLHVCNKYYKALSRVDIRKVKISLFIMSNPIIQFERRYDFLNVHFKI